MRSVWTISCLLFHFFLQAQPANSPVSQAEIDFISRKIDSLPGLLSSKKGVVQTANLCGLPDHTQYHFPQSGFSLSPKALTVKGRSRLAYISMIVFFNRADRFYEVKDYANADSCWQKALEISTRENFDFEELHMARVAINNNCFLSGDYTKAMAISTGGLKKAEQIDDKERMAHFSNVIGYIHMKQNNLAEAGTYFNQYLLLTRQINKKILEAHALSNLSDLSVAKKEYDEALNYLQQAIAIYRGIADTATAPLFSLRDREAYIANKMAEVWKLKQNFPEALLYGRRAVIVLDDPSSVNAYDKVNYCVNVGDIYNRLNYPDSAISFLRKGLALAKKIIHRELMRDSYEQLSYSFAQKKMFDSAFFYHRLFTALKDSIASETSQREIYRHEADLRLEKQELIQKTELARQRMWKNVVAGVAAFCIIILYLLYNRYRLRQKNRYQVELNKQQQEILNTTITVQDQERKRIAADLHDGLGSILSATKLKLSALDEELEQANGEKERLKESLELVDEAVSEMRNIAYNIMPATLSRLGLSAALQNLFNRISSRSNLAIDYSTFGFSKRLDESTELSIYRIILEGINNIVKHAGATHATAQLVKYADHINIVIEDDGKGFELMDEHLFGNGLNNISSRVKKLGGNLDIDSSPGNGTTIMVDIPYVDLP